ncbi:MAG: apolipoprotein N-acyltransferase [Ilumatobacteraceae bacterium]
MSTESPEPQALHARLANPALALGSGTLVALSMPPWGFWPLALIGVVLFEISLRAAPSRRSRMWNGYLFGVGWMYLGMAWMYQLTLPGYIVAGSVFAALHMFAAWVSPAGPWGVIGGPAAHALAEALRFSFPFGGIPLATLGMSQVGGPLLGVVRVGGVILLTWIVFQLGAAIVAITPRIVERVRRSEGAALAADRSPQAPIALGVILCILVLTVVAPRGADTGETLQIAAVQGGGEQGTSALEVPSREVTERHLEATRAISADADLDLVLWPENTVDVRTFEGSSVHEAIADEAERLDTPIAVGITEERMNGTRRINSQVLVLPDGTISARYDKVRRVPFGEYVPLRGLLEAVGAPVEQIGRDAIAGTEPAYLDLPDGTRLGVVISWEVFFAGRAQESVREGAETILNPTNGASYTGTIVQTQQVASSRLRAVETGRWVAQAAPTGFTAIVDSDGDVLQRTAVSEQRVIHAELQLRDGFTWYTNLGNAPFIVALVLVLAASIALDARQRRAAISPA